MFWKWQKKMNDDSPVFSCFNNPTMIDYPGHLSGMFFISGCNFKCGFCHNASLMGKQKKGIPWEEIRVLCGRFKANWVDAVVITGGEPTLNYKLNELISVFKEYGFKIKLDTNGSMCEALSDVIGSVDYVAMDIKCSIDMYPQLTGFFNVEKIKNSVDLIRKSETNYEFRTTVIEPIHTKEEMLKIADLVNGSKKYVLQAFVPRDNLPNNELCNLRKTTLEYLVSTKELINGCANSIEIRS